MAHGSWLNRDGTRETIMDNDDRDDDDYLLKKKKKREEVTKCFSQKKKI